jgi:hypothetical protein
LPVIFDAMQAVEEPSTEPDLACPLCGYNLRGLIEPRCPECGFAFKWDELLDATRHRHPYLFEHGSGRNFVTFWKTFWHTAWPGKFWSVLIPTMPVKSRRLIIYWIVSTAISLAVQLAPSISIAIDVAVANHASRAAYLRPGWVGSRFNIIPASGLSQLYPLPWNWGFAGEVWDEISGHLGYGKGSCLALVGITAVLLWPWASMVTLLIFQASMRKAKVKSVHVLRTVVYSCDFGVSVLLAAGFMVVSDFAVNVGESMLLLLALCAAVSAYRMSRAFRLYLRVHLPAATVIASQLIVLLAFVTAWIGFLNWLHILL